MNQSNTATLQKTWMGEPLKQEPTNENVFHMHPPYTRSNEQVVVFMPFGNYNQLTELGRYKNIGVAMAILSSLNNPDNAFQLPEYFIFSLETGAQIFIN